MKPARQYMDLASSKYILYAVNEDNTSASRFTDDIIIVHETGYRMDMTVVHANVRAAATCSIHVGKRKPSRIEPFWDVNYWDVKPFQ